MYARLTTVETTLRRLDDATKLYAQVLVQSLKARPGFRGIYVLTGRDSGKVSSLSLWEREEDALASERSGWYQEQLEKFREFFAAPPVMEGYDVTVQV
ncbi:MAG: hypothetical protein FJ029_03425 [Actinobacteria bacterium]|nr:hypothetical protein [Actinomycetota bacterium]